MDYRPMEWKEKYVICKLSLRENPKESISNYSEQKELPRWIHWWILPNIWGRNYTVSTISSKDKKEGILPNSLDEHSILKTDKDIIRKENYRSVSLVAQALKNPQ